MKKPHIRMFQNGSCYGHYPWIVFGPKATGLGDTLKMAWHDYKIKLEYNGLTRFLFGTALARSGNDEGF